MVHTSKTGKRRQLNSGGMSLIGANSSTRNKHYAGQAVLYKSKVESEASASKYQPQ